MPTIIKHLILLLISATLTFASIGRISALNGDISISRDSKVVKATAGTTLEQKDVIKSTKGSTAQIVFNDNTIIKVGSATTFKVEEYLFDEKNPNVKFRVEEGSFKAITGKIGKIAPDKFKLETKTATIGIRGTAFVGKVQPNGDLYVACTKGVITLTPIGAFTTPPPPVIVSVGQITKAGIDGTIMEPRKYTPNEINKLNSGIDKLSDGAIQEALDKSQSIAPVKNASDKAVDAANNDKTLKAVEQQRRRLDVGD